MGDKQQYGFASRKLHWLYNPLESAQALRKIIPMQMDKVNPVLVVQENSSKAPPNLAKSNGGSPKEKGTRSKGKRLLHIILGASCGIAAVTATAPIDRVCILMQCQNEMIKAGRLSTPYKGMTDCLLRTIKHEGVLSLWRGNSLNLLRLSVNQAMPFVSVHLSYTEIQKKMKESPLWVLPFAALPSLLWRYPLEYARVRLATDVKCAEKLKFSLDSLRRLSHNIGNRQFNGLLDVYKKTLKLDGIHGVYRGFSVFYIGFVAYEMMRRPTSTKRQPKLHNQEKRDKSGNVDALLIFLGLPVITYPFRTVSRRMMMTSASREASKYRGAMDAFYQIVKNEGTVSSLYRGAIPFLIHRASLTLVGYVYLYTVVPKILQL